MINERDDREKIAIILVYHNVPRTVLITITVSRHLGMKLTGLLRVLILGLPWIDLEFPSHASWQAFGAGLYL